MQSTTENQNKQGVYLVHGYNFNPLKLGKNNPHSGLYKNEWKPHLREWPVYEFSYYSAPGIFGWFKAWKEGYRGSYSWAYNSQRLKSNSPLRHEIIAH